MSDGRGSYDLLGESQKIFNKRRRLIVCIVFSGVLVLAIGLGVGIGVHKRNEQQEHQHFELADEIQLANLMQHLQDLQEIAYQNNGSRAVEFGYSASVQYVMESIQNNTPWKPWIQYFPISVWNNVEQPVLNVESPFVISLQFDTDFNLAQGFKGQVNATGTLQSVNDLGCSTSDYSNFVAGSVAVIRRGDCTFEQKINFANAVSASAIIIYNSGNGSTGMDVIQIPAIASKAPVFFLTYQLGVILSKLPNATISYYCNQAEQNFTTSNLIVDTPFGSEQDTIVVGSHLDSVAAGPGINDNGSGTSSTLELAIQLAQLNVETVNRVRFIWFGAEERGLRGSEYYVASLNETERKNIAMNLNYDMIGSPNYIVGLHDGSLANASCGCVNGSIKIRNMYEQKFNDSGIPYTFIEFDGRSDYGPFLDAGIPAGGVFTGAEKIKTAAQQAIYGGLLETAYDPCYHKACDTVQNINQDILLQISKNAATVLQEFAMYPGLSKYLRE